LVFWFFGFLVWGLAIQGTTLQKAASGALGRNSCGGVLDRSPVKYPTHRNSFSMLQKLPFEGLSLG